MKRIPFQQVDVFTAVPFKGNPVAVVLDGNDLETDQMQAVANWTNLSETTFVCAPTNAAADYRLRIFTPKSELNFAGHPTIGSAHAVLRNGLIPKIAGKLVQECRHGLVPLTLDGERIFFMLPKPRLNEVPKDTLAEINRALGIESSAIRVAASVDVSITWITLQLRDGELVRRLKPDQAQLAALTPRGTAGVTVFGLTGGSPQIEVRSFAPAEGVPEDPVCGSGNGCVAALVRREQLILASSYVAGQGGCMGRDGHVEVRFDGDQIWLGGDAVTCVEGTLQV